MSTTKAKPKDPTPEEIEAALQGAPPEGDDSAAKSAEKYAKRDLADAVGDAVKAKRKAGTGDHNGKKVLDLDDLNLELVKLGGQVWEAVEPTIEVNKELTKALPKIDGDDADAAYQALSSIYPQVARILRDPDSGEPPTREFVERHLSGRNFGRLMEALNADGQEGNA